MIELMQQIKQELTIENIADLLKYLGATPAIVNENVLTCETICHNDLSSLGRHKLYYYHNTKLFRCYTECADTFDIFELYIRTQKVQHNKDISVGEAVYFIRDYFHISGYISLHTDIAAAITSEELELLEYYNHLDSRNNVINDYPFNIYDNSVIENLPFLPSLDWLKEGITIETMRRYDIKYYGAEHKIVIPHYDYHGDLIGIRGRALAIEDCDNYGKYMPLKIHKQLYAHPLSYNLYGLDKTLPNIRRARRIIIFESEKSVMLYDSLFGAENNISVATCGHSISLYQIDLIKSLCEVNEVIIAYDKQFKKLGDEEFQKDVKLLTSLAKKINKYCVTTLMFDKFNKLEYKDAPIDKGKEIFQFLFEHRIVQEVLT